MNSEIFDKAVDLSNKIKKIEKHIFDIEQKKEAGGKMSFYLHGEYLIDEMLDGEAIFKDYIDNLYTRLRALKQQFSSL